MLDVILLGLTFVILAIASYSDFKTREVPDWLSFGAIGAGLGIRAIWSVSTSQVQPFLYGLAGFGAFFLIALAMFYLGQWGGGDSKLLMGLGALFGLELSMNSLAVAFIINALFAGAIYGLFWTVGLAIKNWSQFSRKATLYLNKPHQRTLGGVSFAVTGVGVGFGLIFVQEIFLRMAILLLASIPALLFILFIIVRAVEKTCFYKWVEPNVLTEGDWVAKNVVVDGKRITGPKDLGVSKAQIRQLNALYKKGKIKKVLLKTGIPFVPAFLLAFGATLAWGNPLLLLLQL